MSDTFITVIAIMLTAVLMLVLPVMTMADRVDTVSKTDIETKTSDFVNEIRTTGKLTLDDYDKYVQTITSTGNSFEISMQAQILDENPGVKTTQAETTKIGENVYYNLYTSQLENKLSDSSTKNRITFKEGDRFSVTVKNTNTTIAQIIRNFLYRIAGNDTYQIAAQHGGIVTVNGTK